MLGHGDGGSEVRAEGLMSSAHAGAWGLLCICVALGSGKCAFASMQHRIIRTSHPGICGPVRPRHARAEIPAGYGTDLRRCMSLAMHRRRFPPAAARKRGAASARHAAARALASFPCPCILRFVVVHVPCHARAHFLRPCILGCAQLRGLSVGSCCWDVEVWAPRPETWRCPHGRYAQPASNCRLYECCPAGLKRSSECSSRRARMRSGVGVRKRLPSKAAMSCTRQVNASRFLSWLLVTLMTA